MKIYFISDHYRSRQARNIKFIHGLLSPLFMDSGVKVSILPNTEKYLDEEIWTRSLDNIGESCLQYYNFTDTAVIGFEINPLDKAFLNERNIPWVNIEIHPIRFLEDLYFSVSSSFSFDFSSLFCSSRQIQLAANVLKLKNIERNFDIGSNALLIIGQTPVDKSVYFDGRFKTLKDYIPNLKSLCEKHDAIYYRPHPVESDKDVDKIIIRKFGAKILDNINYYDLLSANQVKTVCGISSSSLHEAKYFGKSVVFLEKRIKKFPMPISLKSLLECNTLWFEGLLSIKDNAFTQENFHTPDNLCRELFGYWSYETDATKAKDTMHMIYTKAVDTEQAIHTIKANMFQNKRGLFDLLGKFIKK